jgi:Kef-type K+ transport system membrane component KefB
LVFGILALVSSAAWLSGGVLGFLFGVPRLRASAAVAATAPTASGLAPNTNLEQISDWLTKIIVGATLVQLRPLADEINSLALAIGAQLATPGAAPVAGAVMITYFAGGFMWGYLWCSLRVFREMSSLISREQGSSRHEAAAMVVETAPAAAE